MKPINRGTAVLQSLAISARMVAGSPTARNKKTQEIETIGQGICRPLRRLNFQQMDLVGVCKPPFAQPMV